MAKGKGFSVEMNLERDTKGTHVYVNEDEDTEIMTLYIRKSAFGGDAPATITVKVA